MRDDVGVENLVELAFRTPSQVPFYGFFIIIFLQIFSGPMEFTGQALRGLLVFSIMVYGLFPVSDSHVTNLDTYYQPASPRHE